MFRKKTESRFCPLIKKPCIGAQCAWATKVRGNNPQTGQEIDQEACAIAWLPTLLIENTQAAHQTGAAIESARNEAANNHHELLAVTLQSAGIVSTAPSNRLNQLDT